MGTYTLEREIFMRRMAHSAIAAIIVSTAACACGQSGDAKTSLQALNSQFTVTTANSQ
jgi:hypothetical protein